ncbi:MAG: branched-chain amino acid ABC transporter permease [Pseudodesulfovibrio sp.]|nr:MULTISPECIES: branched-chain amino acid ABC transporter permease [Pseudodesulfovibrio]MBU4190900.1 branched-chain amino acid ABC transporter permease [Pseudomonadota bacterium]MBU4380192.1 branched-chain amino acid ABC transporter permease [Pseudomonadota bacterium]MBU4475373.1 branched-chain amino acid ABC transporter permease [Pseudomonadota bacterium]MBU4517210.1 branched-chain amino acid ABC transporter permease [Pseudomonadota bacterium]MBU4521844.1 branched-chain amino acid ABC transp
MLLWPLLGIRPEGLQFSETWAVFSRIAVAAVVIVAIYHAHRLGRLDFIGTPLAKARDAVRSGYENAPTWALLAVVLVAALIYPQFAGRYGNDVAISVLIYICLGLGLNIVVGLAGLLDLGYIAFYGVGAYAYALLSLHFGLSFWACLPVAALLAAISGCIIGYPTLRMRGDYLAIVTLGFGEIVRLILNNWMSLTNGPNGILAIPRPELFGFGFASLSSLYYVILGIAVFTVLAVYRLNFSRIGRAWEAIREDETAAELMGVNTFLLKLLAYAMGATFAGLAGAFFAARMRFVGPESFTFLESAMVLAMVVLGGMGSIPGVILGVLALVALPELFRDFELYRMLVFGGVMCTMMLIRPAGLWPAKRVGRRSEEME